MRRRTSASVSRTDRPLLRDQRADLGLLARGRQREQRARVAHLELAFLDQRADGLRQVEQAQQVRHRRARAADGLGGLLVRELELADQARERERLLERVQVLALDVLDEGERDGMLVVDAPQHRRDLVQARHLRGAPAALAGDDLVALRLALGSAQPSGRTTIGWITPWALIESASSCSDSSRMSTRGWYLPRERRSTGICRSCSRAGGMPGSGRGLASPSSASSPRPNPRFLSLMIPECNEGDAPLHEYEGARPLH